MTDLEIRYPDQIDILPFTTTVSVTIGDNINALRDAILNLENVLGLDVNIGLFTPNPEDATVADRLNRIERGIAERNLVFREINVSDALQVLLNQNNQPFVRIGLGSPTQIAPVTIVGPLTILAAPVSNPETYFQTPIRIDVTTLNPEMSAKSSIKGKTNAEQPLLTITDTNLNPGATDYALKISGNMIVTGKLTAEFSIDHNKLINIDAVPTDATRGVVKHVTQGDFHSHRKGKYNSDQNLWQVDSSINVLDHGIISHSDLVGIGTLPTHTNEFQPQAGTAYHVTGGDLHSHKVGDGAQIDHNDLKNVNPAFTNHVTGGDSHAHTSSGDGGQVSHQDLIDVATTGASALHVTGGDGHAHSLDVDGNPIGDGSQISHNHLSNIDPKAADALHVTSGDAHTHGPDGDGAPIDHINLTNKGVLTHSEIDDKISTFRATKTGTAQFTSTNFSEITVQHGLGTDQFNVNWSFVGTNFAPPSNPADVGTIYTSDFNSSTFKFKRAGGAMVGPAVKAQGQTSISGTNNDLLFVARTAGSAGNSISIKYEFNNSITTNPFITASLTSITVFFKTTNPTASAVRLAIMSDPVANTLVDVLDASGNNGTGAIDAYGSFTLSGGSDTSGFNGLELGWTAISKN